MKIELGINKVIIYLYKNNLSIGNINILNMEIKKLFVKLIKCYNFDFFGYFKVSIYHNIKYGSILEIEKIHDYNNEYSNGIIDLKIVIYKNTPMYLEFDDYYFPRKIDKIFLKKEKYLIDINDIDNILEYIEYGKISYNDS